MTPKKPILPKPAERFRAAFRLLMKRGDDAVVCSFCGLGRDRLSHIIAGPGVSICWDCARIATSIAYDSTVQPVTEGKPWITAAPVLAQGEKLTVAHRSALHETLTQQTVGNDCELLTWHYICGHRAAGDYLGFNATCGNTSDTSALQITLKAQCREALELPTLADQKT